jgi:membrane protease YdiL (CAAX protease family)
MTDKIPINFASIQNPKNWKFIVTAILLFPTILLLVASFQPRILFDKDSIYYLFSVSVIYIHLPIFLLLTVIFIHAIGKIKFNDIGLRIGDLKSALWLFPTVWVCEQLVLLKLSIFNLIELKPNEIWTSNDLTIKTISSFITNTLATGLNEETFFRGFLFTQLFLIFRKNQSESPKQLKAVFQAAIVSSVVFAISHFQFSIGAFSFLIFGGLIGCWIYYSTNNLFYGIILHGFFNSPLPLLRCNENIDKFVVLSIIICIILIRHLKKRTTNR